MDFGPSVASAWSHATRRRKLLFGASVISGVVFLVGVGGIPGDIAAWSHWFGWLNGHRSTRVILIAAGLTWLLVTGWLAYELFHSKPRVPSATESGISDATFDYSGQFLVIGIRNDGKSLDGASINVLVPKTLEGIARFDWHTLASKPGYRLETSESLMPSGVPSVYWAETGLRFAGGMSTLMRFAVLAKRPGTYPIKFKIIADELPEDFVSEGVFTIPSPVPRTGPSSTEPFPAAERAAAGIAAETVDPLQIYNKLAEISAKHEDEVKVKTLDQLILEGNRLRLAEIRLQEPPDEATLRFDPLAASFKTLERQSRYMFGPPQPVKEWLKRVWSVVTTSHIEHSDQIVQRGGTGSVTSAKVIAQIDQNLAALRKIKEQLER